jgi:hypothetical protein
MFFELKRTVEEGIYFRAYSHYLLYTISKNYRGDENFFVSEQIPRGFSFSFRDPSDPSKNVYVAVKGRVFNGEHKAKPKEIILFSVFADLFFDFGLSVGFGQTLEKAWRRVGSLAGF